MRVIELRTENFLRVRAVAITPTGDVVKVSGANGEGKTSTIDSIWAALCLSRLNLDKPIHGNAKKAVIKLNLGEILVERVITKGGNDLKVTAADGTTVKAPQKFLDALIGELSFDPLAFERMRPVDQYEQLRHLVKVDIDFGKLAKENEADFNRRQDINRHAKAKRAQAEALPAVPTGFKPIDTAALLDQITKAGEHNASVEKRKAKRAEVLRECEGHERKVQEIDAELERMRAVMKGLEEARQIHAGEAAHGRDRLAAAPPLPDLIDVADVRRTLDEANEFNKQAEKGVERARLEAEADELEQQSAAITDAMDARNASKEKALSEVQMPVEGLSLGQDARGDGEVLYNGHPFSQASAAERLRVSMAIAMAANPKIRVIRISDGSLLDSKSMAIVGEMARAKDFQVWAEVVDESKKIGIVIEDGAVAAVNP